MRAIRRNLYIRTGKPITEADLATALCRSDPRLIVVGLTAARLWKFPLPRRVERWQMSSRIHLATKGHRGTGDAVIRWHDFSFLRGEVITGRYTFPDHRPASPIAITSRARTWRDLAAHLSHESLVVVGDHLVRTPRPELERGRTTPHCTLDELRSVCTGRHASALRRALSDVRVGSDSPRETELRLAFIRGGLPEPELNRPLIGPDGSMYHSPDFQWPEYKVCAEYEGAGHNDPQQVARDIRRARRAHRAGFTELRLYYEDTKQNCAEAVRLVRAALAAQNRDHSR